MLDRSINEKEFYYVKEISNKPEYVTTEKTTEYFVEDESYDLTRDDSFNKILKRKANSYIAGEQEFESDIYTSEY